MVRPLLGFSLGSLCGSARWYRGGLSWMMIFGCFFTAGFSGVSAATFDADRLEQTWLEWTNHERSLADRDAYVGDSRLRATALEWSETAQERGYIDHRRKKNAAYYDYRMIEGWFAARDLEFENIGRKTFTESIGYGYVKCSKSGDCTDALIESSRRTFQFFMSEKGKKYDPHYRAIMMREFERMGVGAVIDEKNNRFYITIHYATRIKGDEKDTKKPSETSAQSPVRLSSPDLLADEGGRLLIIAEN